MRLFLYSLFAVMNILFIVSCGKLTITPADTSVSGNYVDGLEIVDKEYTSTDDGYLYVEFKRKNSSDVFIGKKSTAEITYLDVNGNIVENDNVSGGVIGNDIIFKKLNDLNDGETGSIKFLFPKNKKIASFKVNMIL